MKYEVSVEKRATYIIEAKNETQALYIADEWLSERDFDECIITEIVDEKEDE
jgi:hypothetical protein